MGLNSRKTSPLIPLQRGAVLAVPLEMHLTSRGFPPHLSVERGLDFQPFMFRGPRFHGALPHAGIERAVGANVILLMSKGNFPEGQRPGQYQPGPQAQEKERLLSIGLKARPIVPTEIGQVLATILRLSECVTGTVRTAPLQRGSGSRRFASRSWEIHTSTWRPVTPNDHFDFVRGNSPFEGGSRGMFFKNTPLPLSVDRPQT